MNGKPGIVPVSAVILVMVVSLLAAGCTSFPSSASPPVTLSGTENTVIIRNFTFIPSALTIKRGASVTWVGQDDVNHTVVSDTGAPVAFGSRNLSFGGTFSYTFSKPGTYPYHCSIHPSMTGTITVTPS